MLSQLLELSTVSIYIPPTETDEPSGKTKFCPKQIFSTCKKVVGFPIFNIVMVSVAVHPLLSVTVMV